MQALKALVIGMAVLIVVGMIVVIVTIANRLGKGRAPAAPAAAVAATVELPAGCSVAGMAAAGDRLALRLDGSGDCRQILLVDPASGRLVGRLRLAEAPAAQ
jgi:hypothetical protein